MKLRRGSRFVFLFNYVAPANPKNGVKASGSRASEGKEIKGVYRRGGLR
jgi:hypothetical protein